MTNKYKIISVVAIFIAIVSIMSSDENTTVVKPEIRTFNMAIHDLQDAKKEALMAQSNVKLLHDDVESSLLKMCVNKNV